MGKILAKQVEGGVDLNSEQIIAGRKTFSAPIICQNKQASHATVNEDGFVYWVQDVEVLEQQGNFRMGVVDGRLSMQHFHEGQWINTTT
jgi:hypothetical protein